MDARVPESAVLVAARQLAEEARERRLRPTRAQRPADRAERFRPDDRPSTE